MDTNQKTRNAPKRSAGTSKKKKKAPGLLGLFGGKNQKKKASAAKNATKPSQHKQMTPEEAARRREAAARRRAEAQAAEKAREAQNRQTAAVTDNSIPEMVFKPTAEQPSRVRTPEESKRSEIQRRSAKRTKERQEEAKRSEKRPTVTYTDPAPFNYRKLLLQLGIVVAVVLAIVIGMSVFFRVEHVVVYGNDAYSAWTIQEASGIENGQNLLTFGATRACGKIRTALPYVDTVRIGIKLPDTVNIYIEEFDVLYAVRSGEGEWWLMTSGGKITEKIDSGRANSYTKVLGVEVESPTVGNQAKAVEEFVPVSQETNPEDATGETEPIYTVTGADRLKAALMILDALELNDIVGEAASINVQSLNSLELMYGTRYQVKLGTSADMENKISQMKAAITQLNEYQTGILDCSFTTWTDQVGFTPNE